MPAKKKDFEKKNYYLVPAEIYFDVENELEELRAAIEKALALLARAKEGSVKEAKRILKGVL